MMSPPAPLAGGRAALDAPPNPVSSGGAQTAQEWLKQVVPFKQAPQSTNAPHDVPEPHSQSTPHFACTQQSPELQTPVLQGQSFAQLVQFSPLAQMLSPQTGLQVPPWQVVPEVHAGPHEPPQLSGPHVAFVHAGVQHDGVVVPAGTRHTCPVAHAQSCGHDWQFSPAVG
jgi:hypothetical protein